MNIKINQKIQINKAFESGLIQLYQDIFSESPYFEKFSEEDVKNIFWSYFNNGSLFLKYLDTEIIGFSAVIPFDKSTIYNTIINNNNGDEIIFSTSNIVAILGFNILKIWYLADLGIKRNYRNKGFGTELISEQFKTLQQSSTVILRTSQTNLAVQDFYRVKFGFQDLKITQNVCQTRLDGTIKPDRRILMFKVIP